MSFFEWFKSRKPAEQMDELEPLTQQEFDSAILALARHEYLENDEVIAEMVRYGTKEDKAIELYLFMPVAFCRRLVPEAKYLDEYVDYYGTKKQIKRSFKANKFYWQIAAYTDAYFNYDPQQEVVLKIAGISAEFHAMNRLLNDSAKASVTDLQFAPLIIVR